YLMGGAGLIVIAGLLSPFLLEKITGVWMWIGEKMGAVMSRVILSVVFVFFLTPVAMLYRLFGRKKEQDGDSFFVERNHTFTAADLEKVF
ncbi:SxtJ family membrane protein, partial [Salmonella enterica]|uniref:SxtJ family membrane protein n=1 Tax=Salmonella enterica TaxID=28901 RepID=UPI003CF80E40